MRDDIDTLVLDAEMLDSILKDADPDKQARELEIKLVARLRKHAGNPNFKELGERLCETPSVCAIRQSELPATRKLLIAKDLSMAS